MNTSQVVQLCTLYDIGEAIAPPQAIAGGFVHQIWRLTTTSGSYAVKQLNPATMQKPGIQHAYRLTERIATAMLAEGIPAIVALKSRESDTLHVIEDETFQVYEWVEGTRLVSDAVEPERTRLVGSIFARMHALHRDFPEITPPNWEPFSDDEWDMLTFQAADRSVSWAQRVRNALPRIIEWSHLAVDAGTKLKQTLLVSHRDLDQKNVLWSGAYTPAIIDWEAAGLINPTMELIGAALSWSGLVVGMPNEASFNALLEGYVASGGVIRDAATTAIYGVIGNWLGWLLFNMHRSLGEPIVNEQERQLGESETIQTLTLLYALANNVDTWASWVEKYR